MVSERGKFNTARIELASLSLAGALVENHGYQTTVNASALATSTRPFPALFARYSARTADGYDVAERIVGVTVAVVCHKAAASPIVSNRASSADG